MVLHIYSAIQRWKIFKLKTVLASSDFLYHNSQCNKDSELSIELIQKILMQGARVNLKSTHHTQNYIATSNTPGYLYTIIENEHPPFSHT